MVMDPRKRQKKLERKKAKANSKRKSLVQQGPSNMATRLARCSAAPILHCGRVGGPMTDGMISVIVSRQLSTGNVAFAVFLVDMYCLGVKDVSFSIESRSDYDSKVLGTMSRKFRLVDIEPNATRKLVEGAVEYAKQLGLSPNRDYQKAAGIFGDIDAASCSEEFTYGKDGEPCFISGPYDTPARCHQVVTRLIDSCGPDGFHYVAMSGEDMLPMVEDDFSVDELS